MRKTLRRLSLLRETLRNLETVQISKLALLRGLAIDSDSDIPTWRRSEDPIVCLQTETTSD